LLKTNNTISVTFPDTGGRVSSVVLKLVNGDVVSVSDDTIAFADALQSLAPVSQYTLNLQYNAKQRRDVVVELWNDTGWLSQGTTTVSTGQGVATVNVDLSSDAAPGQYYSLKGSIRPVGTDWTKNLDVAQVDGIEVKANAPAVPTAWAQVQIRHSSKCMDVAGGKTTNGSGLHQWACDSKKVNQKFKFEDRGNGFYSIRAQVSNKCVDLAYGGSTDGQAIQQYSCGATNANQHWAISPTDGGWFELKAKPSSKCLDVKSSGQSNGAAFQQWTCSNVSNQ
jgi:hypothetical protein